MRIPSGRKCSTCIRDGESVLTYFARKKIWHGKGRADAIPRTSPERKRIESCHGNQTPSPMPPLTLTPSQTATSKQPLDAISSSTGQSLKRIVDTSESDQLKGIDDGDCASVALWMKERIGSLLPALDRIDLQQTPGNGVTLSWGSLGPALPI